MTRVLAAILSDPARPQPLRKLCRAYDLEHAVLVRLASPPTRTGEELVEHPLDLCGTDKPPIVWPGFGEPFDEQ